MHFSYEKAQYGYFPDLVIKHLCLIKKSYEYSYHRVIRKHWETPDH